MASSGTFIGAGFYVTGAALVSGNVVRVSFSSAPKTVSPLDSNDALNYHNYSISGPGPGAFSSVSATPGDSLSVDVSLTAALVVGSWTVTVFSVVSSTLVALVNPVAAAFSVTVSGNTAPLSGGAQNDTSEQIIRKHLNAALKGPTWDALIYALGLGDTINWDNSRLAVQQLSLATAQGKYLEKRAGDVGETKPRNLGPDDETFRQLAIRSGGGPVHRTLRGVLETYYGSDALRAYAETSLDAPYDMLEAPTLEWELDGRQNFTHTFAPAQFGVPSAATALEVAFALTQTMRAASSQGYAVPHRSSTTGLYGVRIYSGATGLGSSVRITGGTSQTTLGFPDLIDVYSGDVSGLTYTWVYTSTLDTLVELSVDTGTTPLVLDLSPVQAGDYAILGQDMQSGVTGVFPVLDVRTAWSGTVFTQSFRIPAVDFNGTAVQLQNVALAFYRPTKRTVYSSGGHTATVTQGPNSQLGIVLPATTKIVTRTPRLAAYLLEQPSVPVVSIRRTPDGTATITTATPHGLDSGAVGRHFLVDDVLPSYDPPSESPGNASAYPAAYTYSAGVLAHTSPTQTPITGRLQAGACTVLDNGDILFAAGFITGFGLWNYCNRYRPSTPTAVVGGDADGTLRHGHSWIATASVSFVRQDHGLSPYQGGALITGGWNSVGNAIVAAELYDSTSNSWSVSNPLFARTEHQQCTLDSGAVLIMGGASNSTTALATAQIFNGVWASGPNMTYPRVNFAAVKLSDGRVLAIGGRTLSGGTCVPRPGVSILGETLDTCEIYDGASWVQTGRMAMTRAYHQAVVLPGDYVLVTGGVGHVPSHTTPPVSLRDAELWDPNTGRWARVQPGFARRHRHLMAVLGERAVVLGGESSFSDDVSAIEVFDLTTRTWTKSPSSLAYPYGDIFGATSPTGEVVYVGGYTGTGQSPYGAFIDGEYTYGSSGINGQHTIASVPAPDQIQFITRSTPATTQFANCTGGIFRSVSAPDGAINAPGPYVLDPDGGVAITSVAAPTLSPVYANQHYAQLELGVGGELFSEAGGWITLGFGTASQTPPIRSLGGYQTGPTSYVLVLDYTYQFVADFATGTTVIQLAQQAPYAPDSGEELGLFYITDSPAGRVGAAAAMDELSAAGVDLNVQVTYPGDTGLGGAGLPTSGSHKLSDIVAVFAGPDVDAEVQQHRSA